MGLRSLALGEKLCNSNYPPFFVHGLPGGMGLDGAVCLPLLLILRSFIFLLVEDLLVFMLLSSITALVNNCNFGLPVGGGELRVFLLCHLGHYSMEFHFKSAKGEQLVLFKGIVIYFPNKFHFIVILADSSLNSNIWAMKT